MIIGIGTDIVSVARIAEAMRKHEHFTHRILTESERTYCQDEPRKVASRWAAKEALYKALSLASPGEGAPAKGLSWLHVEVGHLPSGAPTLSWSGQGDTKAHLSLSHEDDFAVAFVILERL